MSAQPMEQADENPRHHKGAWSEEDYLALDEDTTQRTELIDGGLVMTPRGDWEHQKLGFRLTREFDSGLPDGIEVAEGNVRLGPGRIVVPDVVVTTYQGNDVTIGPSEVLLVAEVVSPSSKTIDRVWKPQIFAEAGIPWYLRVERDPDLTLVLFRLQDEAYVLHSKAVQGERLAIPELGCEIEVDALLRRRG